MSTSKQREPSGIISGTGRTPQKSKLAKQIPKKIIQDKEELYEEVLRLKNENHFIRTENTQMKTELKKNEHELAKNEKTIQELIEKMKSKDGQMKSYGTSTHLLQSLKKKNKDLRKENKEMQDEILALHKDIRLTNVHEIEVETQMYFEECVRLRKMLDEFMSSEKSQELSEKENTDKQQADLLKTIKQENESLATTIKKKEETIKEYEKTIEDSKKESEKHQKTLDDNQKLILSLKSQVSELTKQLDEKSKQEKMQKYPTPSKELAEKDDAIRTLEMKIVELKRTKDNEIRKLKENIRERIFLLSKSIQS